MLQTLFHKYNLGWDPIGRSFLMYLQLCSKALSTDNEKQKRKSGEREREDLEGEKKGQGGSLQGRRGTL